MTQVDGAMTFVAAAVFAIGITFFWPTMISFVAENIPESGALGLSVMGGLGMLSVFYHLANHGKNDGRQYDRAGNNPGDVYSSCNPDCTVWRDFIFYMRKRESSVN